MRQVRLFDKCVGPKPFHQLIFFDQPFAVFHEHEKCIECFRRERNHDVSAEQQAFRHVQPERSEFIIEFGIAAFHRIRADLELV